MCSNSIPQRSKIVFQSDIDTVVVEMRKMTVMKQEGAAQIVASEYAIKCPGQPIIDDGEGQSRKLALGLKIEGRFSARPD